MNRFKSETPVWRFLSKNVWKFWAIENGRKQAIQHSIMNRIIETISLSSFQLFCRLIPPNEKQQQQQHKGEREKPDQIYTENCVFLLNRPTNSFTWTFTYVHLLSASYAFSSVLKIYRVPCCSFPLVFMTKVYHESLRPFLLLV